VDRGPLRASFAVLAMAAVTLAGCGGGSQPQSRRTPPDLAAFLRLPVATPTACPSRPAAAAGRRSPWVGHVDVSVFVSDDVTQGALADLGARLHAEPHVTAIYAETKQQAYAEFQRLYQCSAAVPPNSLPASFRLALDHVTTRHRDALVRRIYRLPGVDSVSCDPSSPCTHIRRKSRRNSRE